MGQQRRRSACGLVCTPSRTQHPRQLTPTRCADNGRWLLPPHLTTEMAIQQERSPAHARTSSDAATSGRATCAAHLPTAISHAANRAHTPISELDTQRHGNAPSRRSTARHEQRTASPTERRKTPPRPHRRNARCRMSKRNREKEVGKKSENTRITSAPIRSTPALNLRPTSDATPATSPPRPSRYRDIAQCVRIAGVSVCPSERRARAPARPTSTDDRPSLSSALKHLTRP